MTDEVSKCQPIVLHGLRPEEYEHPLDRKALDSLEGTPGLEALIRKFNQFDEKVYKFQYIGSNIKVTSEVFPEVYEILLSVCRTINLKQIPGLYIQAGMEINAFVSGSENPIIVLNEAAVENLSSKELTFVIGHEVGHIKSQHMVYSQLARSLSEGAIIGISQFLTAPINIALGAWARKAEFTCDRAGLLACQDIDATVTAFMKMSGAPKSHYRDLDPKTFINQARELETYDNDTIDKVAKIYSIIGNTHPWTVVRCAELSDWIDYGSYYELLTRSREPILQKKGFCKHCGKQVKSEAKFCIFCGSEI